ncbi:uncharacterized protein [Physcomitrium patens]|uniref:Uncharacterized protein n=1 Tax=Physcomitrium patens TaxID=3218 RepID=A0A2K1KAT9_PHYPA|nr:uncharacterized protein LOC112284653 isoform X3 [Physcomitrium patens]PNR50892.1 hypothetical protein PHYPA_010078 [Physcomitrium patens]|eukprot:XP_024380426.1 uncharacterized protein LOC112284653 isoform X3 [Physcomitrella patens]
MPAWLFLTVAGGILTGLLLATIIGFHLVESNAGPFRVQNKRQHESFTGAFESRQLFCPCGNVRNRKGPSTRSTEKPEVVKSEGVLQALADAAYQKLTLGALLLRCFGSQTFQRPDFVKCLQGSWLNAGKLFKRIRKVDTPILKAGECQHPAVSTGCPVSISAGPSVSASVNASGAGSTTTITTTITTTTPSSSSAPTSCGASSTGGENGTSEQPPQRRLVLEILMSTSEGGALPRATGVRLKLESNASSDSLANVAAVSTLGAEGPNLLERDDNLTDLTSTTCGSIPSTETGSCISNGLPRSASSGLKTVCHVSKQGGATGNGSAASNNMNTSGSLASSSSFSANATKSKSNSNLTSSSKSKSKGGSASLQCSSLSSGLPTATACSVNSGGQSLGTCRAPESHQGPNNLSPDGLGALRISLLEAGAKGKSVKECTKGVTADIASALAALNVDSIVGKGVGMGTGIALGGMMTETGKTESSAGFCSNHSSDILLDEEGMREGGGSGKDGKKEKKKKKHRSKKHKGKRAAVSGTGDVSTDVKESEKLVTEHSGTHTVAASSEVELGCLCGTVKGGCHSSNCPYPFTYSGSMVQRKIKEQYDELVRSNAAKTLTLAQVGRFTTCLVETKSALQQKSDTIQRRFTIAKSLLSKADKSSFDRLCGQIYGLENEQKKLEEDTVVYNRLQEQLKLSPAYLKMLEYGRAHFELQPNTGQLIEKFNADDEELSFEELLAQEKKDSFWQKHSPARSSVQVS